MSRLITIIACLMLALSLGCGDDKKSKEPAPTPEPPTPELVEAPIADEDLAVAADFEAEADEQITADNYQAELAALEQELAQP